MRHSSLGLALRAAIVAFVFAIMLSLPNAGAGNVFMGQAQATELQLCSAPQQSCGCSTCGGGDFGLPHCPTGYSPYDDFCLPDCPADFIRYPGMPGLCMPPAHHGCEPGYDPVPLASCPEGYYRDLRNPDVCMPDIDYRTHLDACPQGMAWSYDHGRCEADCPQGTYRDGHGLCQSNYAQECPKDFTRDPASGKCVPPGVWPPVTYNWVCLPFCPPGTFRDIRHPTLCLPPPPTCEQGYEKVGGRCLPICDKDARRDPYGNCFIPCPQGSYLNLRGQCQLPECPQGTRRNDRGECLPPTHICDQGQETFDGKCVPICRDGLSRDARGNCVPDQPTCPQGQRLNFDTGQCVRIPPNTPNCNQNQIYSSVLHRCQDIPPPVHCDQGQYKNSDGRCVDIPQPPQLQPDCPPGYRSDGQGGCLRGFVPTNCPQGTVLDRRTNSCMPLRGLPNLPTNQGGNLGGNLAPQQPPHGNLAPLNPALLQQLTPKAGINIQQPCPDGTTRDNNGRCVGPNIK